MRVLRGLLVLASLGLSTQYLALSTAFAHPVPRSHHDRTIVVRLALDATASQVLVTVQYRLEVDELTVVLEDMAPFKDEIHLENYRDKAEAYYGEFLRAYAPILAGNLTATVDGKAVPLRCVQRGHSLRDEHGQVLGHLRCDFVFRAAFDSKPGQPRRFRLREGNYETQEGLIDLSVVPEGSIEVSARVEPDAALKKRARFALGPDDEERLRGVGLTFTAPALATGAAAPAPTPRAAADAVAQGLRGDERTSGQPSLLYYFLSSGHTFPALLIIFAYLGAMHALLPGHGKTLVAAYLVGERGTVWHALLLGLVTTLTHTGAVFGVGIALLLLFPQGILEGTRRDVQTALELIGGLLVFALGAWLFFRRLAGRADHLHLGGHRHHHHGHGLGHSHGQHDHADHYHDADGHAHPLPESNRQVGWRPLLLLGINGGIVPCWDAIVVLIVGISADLLPRALVLLLAFSAGLACVLVAVGILVVYAKDFAAPRWGGSRFMKALPLLSAALVVALGFWLCYDSLHGRPPEQHARATAAPRP
jgi:ABC-type nickel/cobalt efflux system permease component RcnA